MKYQLVDKRTGEIITVTDSRLFGLIEAKAYYVRVKQLKEKEFDKLFIVQSEKRPVAGYDYKWWEEEETGLDPF